MGPSRHHDDERDGIDMSTNVKRAFRIFVDIAIGISVIFGWWFLAIPLSAVGAWAFSYFLEAIAFGFIFDLLFGAVPGMGLAAYSGTIATIIILVIVVGSRKVLRK